MGYQIDFKIDCVVYVGGGEGGVGYGVWDQGDFKIFVVYFVDGEVDVVYVD